MENKPENNDSFMLEDEYENVFWISSNPLDYYNSIFNNNLIQGSFTFNVDISEDIIYKSITVLEEFKTLKESELSGYQKKLNELNDYFQKYDLDEKFHLNILIQNNYIEDFLNFEFCSKYSIKHELMHMLNMYKFITRKIDITTKQIRRTLKNISLLKKFIYKKRLRNKRQEIRTINSFHFKNLDDYHAEVYLRNCA